MLSFKVLSRLLSYPDDAFHAALQEGQGILRREALLKKGKMEPICRFMDDLAAQDIWKLQEEYVALFDRTRSLSLHLYEHVHGESRDRGQAMVNLAQEYRLHGLELHPSELPDYLPLFLEFLSEMPTHAAVSYLKETTHILAALAERLRRQQSNYAVIFDGLVTLSAVKIDASVLKGIMDHAQGNTDDPAMIDNDWEEEAVSFMAGGRDGAACGKP